MWQPRNGAPGLWFLLQDPWVEGGRRRLGSQPRCSPTSLRPAPWPGGGGARSHPLTGSRGGGARGVTETAASLILCPAHGATRFLWALSRATRGPCHVVSVSTGREA